MPSKSTRQLTESISRGETSARATIESAVSAAEQLNDSLNAFLEIDRNGALSRAEAIDTSANKESLRLAGLPIAIKDNICVNTNRPTTQLPSTVCWQPGL